MMFTCPSGGHPSLRKYETGEDGKRYAVIDCTCQYSVHTVEVLPDDHG